MKFICKKTLFVLITICFVIGALEFIFQIFSLISPRVNRILSPPPPAEVFDNLLGLRPNPKYPGHDAWGFRNPAVPNRVDIVTLGDSQTYGFGVESYDSWPKQLESMTDHTVYSMAFGSYGPAHSIILWNEATTLDPKIIIQAFYSGNDLFDSFNLAYNISSPNEFSELKSNDVNVIKSIQSEEKKESIEQRVLRMHQMGKEYNIFHNKTPSLRLFLSNNSKFYGLLRSIRYQLRTLENSLWDDWKDATKFAEENPEYTEIFQKDLTKTIFTPEYRLSALDLNDPRIQEGHQISLKALLGMNNLSISQGIRFFVVLIPTKETVFRELVVSPSTNYQALFEHEKQFWSITMDFLEKHGIEYLDALPALRKQLSIGDQPYHVSADGHPNKIGHKVLAELVFHQLRKKNYTN